MSVAFTGPGARSIDAYGFYVDHVIDIAGTTMLLAGIGFSGLMHPVLAEAFLAGYLLTCAESARLEVVHDA